MKAVVSKTGRPVPKEVEDQIAAELGLPLQKMVRSSPFQHSIFAKSSKFKEQTKTVPALEVQEIGGQWYVVYKGKKKAGPFGSKEEAYAELVNERMDVMLGSKGQKGKYDKLRKSIGSNYKYGERVVVGEGWEGVVVDVDKNDGDNILTEPYIYTVKRPNGNKVKLTDRDIHGRVKSLKYHTKDQNGRSKWEGKPCEPGVSAARTGCIPAKPEGPKVKPSTLGERETPKPSVEDVGAKNKKLAEEHYGDLKEIYLKKGGGVFDENGQLRSVVLNTDDWRPLFPGYVGTNSQDVHAASSYCNKRLLAESLKDMKSKGNNTVVILAGGGGSGKSGVGKFFDESQYPIRLDQVSDELESLEAKIDSAKKEGYDIDYVFVDRQPTDAWLRGVVSRAINSRKKGEPARTVPLKIALRANIEARKTAAELIRKRPDIPVRILDNTKGFENARLITDKEEALNHLEKEVYDYDNMYRELEAETRKMDIPEDIMSGLLQQDVSKSLLQWRKK